MRIPPATIAIAAALLGLVRPAMATTTADLCSGNPCIVAGAVTVDASSVLDFGSGTTLRLGPTAVLTIGPGAGERAVTLRAGEVVLQAGARILGGGDLANLTLEATGGDLRLYKSGSSSARIDLSGDQAGSVTLRATGDAAIGGVIDVHASGTDSQGGDVTALAGGSLAVTGEILIGSTGAGSAAGNAALRAAGGVTLAGTLGAVGGSYGGGNVEIDSTAGAVVITGSIDTTGGNPDGSAGSLDVTASAGDVTISGPVTGKGGTGAAEACGDGAIVTITAGGSVTSSARLDVTSGRHCFGGEVTITAGSDFAQLAGGEIVSQGPGIYGSGGEITITAGGDATLRAIDATSPGAGGQVNVAATAALAVEGKLDASGTGAAGFAGNVTLAACTISVASGAEVLSLGDEDDEIGVNRLEAGGAMTVEGSLRAAVANELRHRTSAPVVTGTVEPAADVQADPSLPACPLVPVCGNAAIEGAELCDDGNTTSCDGCRADCTRFDASCGDGVEECSEACDDGNTIDGDGCESDCTRTPLPGLRLPGEPRDTAGCLAEWSLPGSAAADPVTGFARASQACEDGDPACDTDGAADGTCTFEVRACLRVPDPGLPSCSAAPISYVKIRRPVPGAAGDATDAQNAAALRDALIALGGTVRAVGADLASGPAISGEDTCTQPIGLRVPTAGDLDGKRNFSVAAKDGAGLFMQSNTLRLRCKPRPKTCGDGILGESEECDDGPSNGTPGSRCSAQCQILPAELRVPGGAARRLDCFFEWSVDLPPDGVRLDGYGLPVSTQDCKDNDPTCDYDPAVGSCRFRVWGCFAAADARLGCAATQVTGITVDSPRADSKRAFEAAARATIDASFAALAFPLSYQAEVCTERMDLDVPVGTERLNLRVRARAGTRVDADALRLRCRRR